MVEIFSLWYSEKGNTLPCKMKELILPSNNLDVVITHYKSALKHDLTSQVFVIRAMTVDLAPVYNVGQRRQRRFFFFESMIQLNFQKLHLQATDVHFCKFLECFDSNHHTALWLRTNILFTNALFTEPTRHHRRAPDKPLCVCTCSKNLLF